MSKKANSALDRRSAIRFGAVGAAATAATAATVATASNAQAAAGQAVLQGRVNTPGATDTSIIAPTPGIAFTVKNTGAGAAGYFFAANGNGFAGGTSAANKLGLSTANTATVAGAGAAMGAVGVNNTGVLANTRNLDRFAVEAVNLSTVDSGEGGGGALWADGGSGVGVAAISPIGVPAVVSIGDLYYIEGHEVVETASGAVAYGVTSAMGPEVAFSTKLTLNGSGAASWDLTEGSEDVDFTNAVSLVSANSAPMPNLWITTNPSTNVVSVAGGTAGGSVSVRVIGVRNDWSGYEAGKTGRSAGGARVAKAKSFAGRLAKRARRG